MKRSLTTTTLVTSASTSQIEFKVNSNKGPNYFQCSSNYSITWIYSYKPDILGKEPIEKLYHRIKAKDNDKTMNGEDVSLIGMSFPYDASITKETCWELDRRPEDAIYFDDPNTIISLIRTKTGENSSIDSFIIKRDKNSSIDSFIIKRDKNSSIDPIIIDQDENRKQIEDIPNFVFYLDPVLTVLLLMNILLLIRATFAFKGKIRRKNVCIQCTLPAGITGPKSHIYKNEKINPYLVT